jgi:hypothetical protein
MAMPSVQASRDRYISGTSGAGAKWQEGASRFEGDPTALAAAALPKAKQNYNAAVDSGRMARALAAAGKAGWLQGINRPEAVTAYGAGTAGKGADKWAGAMQQWFPIFDALSRQIDSMPNATPQDSINRVAAWINGTIAAKQNL